MGWGNECELRQVLPAQGVISQSQVLLSFGVVAELFNGVRDVSHRPEPYQGMPVLVLLKSRPRQCAC